ncbi:hypothetical protein [Paenibacillus sp. BK720]|uniref:hypothetical protein n=1 Tax=Paenibacillus sp. BK720 TaxID=2587092 RepID=UPI0032671489|nr:adenine deaminase [Paenibacillus sp. BK720]
MNTKDKIAKRIEVAAKREAADLIIRNGNIVNVFTGSIQSGDIAIVDGVIAGIGRYTEGLEVIDAKGQWVIPGLIGKMEASTTASAWP